MSNSSLSLAVSLALGMGFTISSPGLATEAETVEAPEAPDLAGTWERNEELSDDPRQQIRAAM